MLQQRLHSYNILGLLLEQLGRIDEALSYYDKAIQLNPKHDIAHDNKDYIVIYFRNPFRKFRSNR